MMSEPAADNATAGQPASGIPDPVNHIVVGQGTGTCLFTDKDLDTYLKLPLPGLIIFVHGVNSDGEWYSAAEEGLCKGLNDRMRRRKEDLAIEGTEAGQMKPVKYMDELTPDGFINPKMSFKTFIQSDDTYSPVIRFRWGYKGEGKELQEYGDGLYLNEENYWGGGPFANGCSALPDLWGAGLSEDLFMFLHVQHMNPTNDRQVYACPPRYYYVLAAYRLAKLVESLRQLQADVPITIVCHSQGNMVAMAAAFLGDAMPPVTDELQKSGRCVADTYVLCNPPYSLLEDNFTENWTSVTEAKNGGKGRVTGRARHETLKNFFKIIGAQRAAQQATARIDERHGGVNACKFSAAQDRERYGLGGPGGKSTHGRVTLYCNPHDQVISASPVQGMGWRGVSGPRKDKNGEFMTIMNKRIGEAQPETNEMEATGAAGVFTQRVFAQGFLVGKQGQYNYWTDHWRPLKKNDPKFWFPTSQKAKYSLAKGLEANKSFLGKTFTLIAAPIFYPVTAIWGPAINGMPPQNWTIPLEAPDLPYPFKPQSVRFGVASEQFDQGYDAPGEARDRARVREADDPYLGNTAYPKKRELAPDEAANPGRKASDVAEGGESDEAALRYEHHALLRMKAKREGMYANDAIVTAEDKPDTADEKYKAWRSKHIKASLASNVDSHATDHSTIMTNPMHAEKALAYDVALGTCDIPEEALHTLRIAADWRFLRGLDKGHPHKFFEEHFVLGTIGENNPSEWSKQSSEGKMPGKIIGERQSRPLPDTVFESKHPQQQGQQ